MTNLYKVVIGALFTLCFIYAVDNPTPNHVKRNWLTWEESIEWKMLKHQQNKLWDIEAMMVGEMNMMATNNNPATGKND